MNKNHKEILLEYRKEAEEKEELYLHKKAALSKDHCRYLEREDDHRLPYKRDVDRIIHSKAYNRYGDKTQVVYLIDNDHITHRSLHVQLVSSFAKGIAEILRLNLNLVEAIALGHDVGHPPFGHEGEHYLSTLSNEYGNGFFSHPLQSCRLFTELEPLNLGLNVYDGFLCHDGAMNGTILKPEFGKTWKDHFKERESKKENPDLNLMPSTLEGCLVKICDTMSYVGRDIEDAIQLKLITRNQIPETILGKSNREILAALAQDIIQMSYNQDYIALSEPAYQALKTLRQFNFRNIYIHPKLKIESKKVKTSYRIVFELLLEDFNKHQEKSYLFLNFLESKADSYLEKTTPVQKVVDYISGMTDNFFIKTLEALAVPKQIQL
jgi:dGTPase